MRKITLMLVVGCLLFAGCSEAVVFRHPQTGATVTCGPYSYFGGRDVYYMSQCIQDYQRQGFERIPK